jgi:hypothetical protein
MATPRVVPVTFTSDPNASDVVAFLDQLAGSAYWSDVTAPYGIGALRAAPAMRLAEAPPAGDSSQEVEDWLRSKLMSDHRFPQPTDETIYALFLPGAPVAGFAGYHLDFALPNGSIVTYLVVRNDGPIDSVTTTTSHELAEAATDPRPSHGPAWSDLDVDHRGWELLARTGSEFVGTSGGEIGDVCPFLIQPMWQSPLSSAPPRSMLPAWSMPSAFVPGIDYEVQRMWSNRAAADKHDPCIPSAMSPYFNSAVVLPDTVKATDSAGNKFTTRGVHIPVGQTRTLEVDLFSDEPTAPWAVAVEDQTSYQTIICEGTGPAAPVGAGSPIGAAARPMDAAPPDPSMFPACSSVDPTIDRSLDKNTGKDGDRLHVTLTQRASITGGTRILVITNTLGDARTVWPLVVVE